MSRQPLLELLATTGEAPPCPTRALSADVAAAARRRLDGDCDCSERTS